MENSNSKLVNLDALDKIAKELRRKALADINQQEEEIEKVRDMFGGKSFRYVLQEEYDNLSEEEKNDPSIVWSIIDAEESVSKEYVDEEVAKINDMLQHMGEGIKAELDKKSNILNYSDHSLNGTETYNNLEKVIGSGSEAAYIINKPINLTKGTTCSIEVKFSDNTNLLLQGEVISLVLHEKQVNCIQITGSGTTGLMVIDKARYTIKDGSGAPEHDDNVSSLLVLHPNANNAISLTITKPTVFEINNSFFTNYQFVNDTEKENWNNKADKTYVDEQLSNVTNNNIIEAELDLLLEEIFGINSKNELTSVRLGNYQMKYDNVNDTLDFLYNGAIDEPIVPNIYVREGLSMYIDAQDVTSYGSIRDITGNQTVTNHGVTHTSDNNYLNFVVGQSDYLDTDFTPNLTQWSVELYFYFTKTPTTTQNIVNWGVSGNRIKIAYIGNYNGLTVQSNNDATRVISTDSNLSSPHHLIVTMNNGALTSYLDGVKTVLCESGDVQSSHESTLKIGTKYDASKEFANLNLRTFRFYDGKVLSDMEALQNYNYELNRDDNIIKPTWIDGKSMIDNGNIVVNEQAVLSNFIKIDNSYNYTINYTDKVYEIRMAYYDSTGTYMSRGDYFTSGAVDTVVEFPENTAYVRIKAEKNGITVNEVNDNIIFKKVLK